MVRRKAVRRSADADGSDGVDLDEWLAGRIDIDEFCDFHSAHGLHAETSRRVFEVPDQHGDGSIARDALAAAAHDFYRSDDPGAPGTELFGPIDA